jgi:hypothetical protein
VLIRFVPTPEDIAQAHRARKRVLLAGSQVTRYDPDVCQRAADAQLDAVLTDFPLECAALWRGTRRASPSAVTAPAPPPATRSR